MIVRKCLSCKGRGRVFTEMLKFDAESDTHISEVIKTDVCEDCCGTGRDFGASDCEYRMSKNKQEIREYA